MGIIPIIRTVALLASIPFTLAIDKVSDPVKNQELKDSATTLVRHSHLNSSDWVYDFNTAIPLPEVAYKPGSVKNANAATFPVLTDLGMTISQLNLGPCAMLPPHLHPRATNLVLSISGNTTTYMWNENGVNLVQTEMTPGKVTVFPRGSLHAMQNNGCDNAYLVSALNSEDTGTLNILNGLWSMPQDMVRAAFGNANIDVSDLSHKIPDPGTGSVLGSAECIDRCKLDSHNRRKGR
ncbi:RmlC-like cupin [Massarina eburnea CBS 473.64]|uniref:RmlC-like cupin n=1 Tax=Massarina eburnea CBS 473.64 TaxID=1395130 RepID=A0A6A6RYI8_9PLEO|nr:RmlC-like cupin [Massarina eburnea CBS 473.64]